MKLFGVDDEPHDPNFLSFGQTSQVFGSNIMHSPKKTAWKCNLTSSIHCQMCSDVVSSWGYYVVEDFSALLGQHPLLSNSKFHRSFICIPDAMIVPRASMSSGLEEKKAMASSCQSLISLGLMLCLPLLIGIVAQPTQVGCASQQSGVTRRGFKASLCPPNLSPW